MYKTQVKLEKVFCLMALIASALVFVYSLGLVTDLYDALYTAMYNPRDLTETGIAGAQIYYSIQGVTQSVDNAANTMGFNTQLMLAGLGLIIISLGLFLTNTHKRRRYYIGNYVATGVWSVAAVAVSVWAHIQISAYKAQFLQVDFEQMRAYAAEWKGTYSDSTFWFDAHYLVFGLVILAVVILVANVFWKNSLMKQEAELLAGSSAAAKDAPAKV